jgi:hypothetical protein
MLALNLANCWKNLLFRLISRKLFINKNLHNIFWKDILKLEIINIYIKFINKNLNRFFRDHMLKTIKNYNNYTTSNKVNNKNLGSYLAGLIEGDCSII